MCHGEIHIHTRADLRARNKEGLMFEFTKGPPVTSDLDVPMLTLDWSSNFPCPLLSVLLERESLV